MAEKPLGAGARAPEFTLTAHTGEPVSLSAICSRGPVVLFFYPKADTPG